MPIPAVHRHGHAPGVAAARAAVPAPRRADARRRLDGPRSRRAPRADTGPVIEARAVHPVRRPTHVSGGARSAGATRYPARIAGPGTRPCGDLPQRLSPGPPRRAASPSPECRHRGASSSAVPDNETGSPAARPPGMLRRRRAPAPAPDPGAGRIRLARPERPPDPRPPSATQGASPAATHDNGTGSHLATPSAPRGSRTGRKARSVVNGAGGPPAPGDAALASGQRQRERPARRHDRRDPARSTRFLACRPLAPAGPRRAPPLRARNRRATIPRTHPQIGPAAPGGSCDSLTPTSFIVPEISRGARGAGPRSRPRDLRLRPPRHAPPGSATGCSRLRRGCWCRARRSPSRPHPAGTRSPVAG